VLHGLLTASSVDLATGEERASGDLVQPGVRNGLPLRAARGDCVVLRDAALADDVTATLRALDAERGWPVTARFDVASGRATLAHAEPAVLSPVALVRVLATRVADGRLARDAALHRLTAEALASDGTFVIASTPPAPIARGLAASPGVAAGRLATPDDFRHASPDPRIVIVDDAAPEDAMAIRAAAAVIATSGGLTADAAIAARALRKPCVVSAPVRLGDRDQPARGDWVTVDGASGSVYIGALPTRWSPTSSYAAAILDWIRPHGAETLAQALDRARNPVPQGAGS